MISRIKTLLSTIELGRLDKRRVDLAMAWAQRHPLASGVYNLGNYAFLGAVKTGVLAVQSIAKFKGAVLRGKNRSRGDATAPGEEFPMRALPECPRVLLVVEESIPQCFQYRVQQKLNMLQALGWASHWLPWSNLDEVNRSVHFYDVILLYRVPGFDSVMDFIAYALSLNKLVIYDLDDLIFDRAQLENKFSGNRGQLSRKVYNDLLDGADLYRKALSAIPFCLVSTEPLRQEVEKVSNIRAFVLPNGVSSELSQVAKEALSARDEGTVNIFYGSGTTTHDADFLYVSRVLQNLLIQHPETNLVIVGPVQLDTAFDKFEERITRIPFLDYPSYLEVLAHADINIAPLEAGIFADCKSEIKWIEAGLLGLPSVVSRTRTYEQVITQGETGYMAADAEEWQVVLSKLIVRADLRQRMGRSARAVIADSYNQGRLSHRLRDAVEKCDAVRHKGARDTAAGRPAKSRLMLVNTLYPPQAMGGATRVVKDLVDGLQRAYPGVFEISIFTCDIGNTHPYKLYQYIYEGIVVTSLSIPMRPDLEIQYEDDRVKDIFKQQLAYVQPAIVHFHSIQRLTASVLEAAAESAVPYVVTVHDSWWISDYPFMIDDNQELIPPNISHPLVAHGYSADLNATIRRNRFLRQRLAAAQCLIAVSDYQARLYRDNGFDQVRIIENGVDAPTGYRKISSDKLVLGYVGGISVHKGYYFLRESIARSKLPNLRIVVVDLFSKNLSVTTEKWGETPVEVHPRFDLSKAGEFYSMIDGLIVPSLWPESFGLVVREAALLKLWVVAADTGGLAGAVIDGKTGYSFEAGNSSQLEKILLEMDRNWQKYKRPVDQASVDLLKISTVVENVHQMHDLYLEVLARQAPAATVEFTSREGERCI